MTLFNSTNVEKMNFWKMLLWFP